MCATLNSIPQQTQDQFKEFAVEFTADAVGQVEAQYYDKYHQITKQLHDVGEATQDALIELEQLLGEERQNVVLAAFRSGIQFGVMLMS